MDILEVNVSLLEYILQISFHLSLFTIMYLHYSSLFILFTMRPPISFAPASSDTTTYSKKNHCPNVLKPGLIPVSVSGLNSPIGLAIEFDNCNEEKDDDAVFDGGVMLI